MPCGVHGPPAWLLRHWYESEYGIAVLEYGLEYRGIILESSDLPSRNIPVRFFLPVQIRHWTSGSLDGDATRLAIK